MERIDFYHLQKNSLEEALPKLVIKAYQTGKKIKIKVGNELRVDPLNMVLWTFEDESFLPHGTKKDGFADLEPIYLSADDEVPNEASLLFLVDGANIDPEQTLSFDRVFYIFDGHSEDELAKARKMWSAFKGNEAERHYWQQNDTGKWEEKQL